MKKIVLLISALGVLMTGCWQNNYSANNKHATIQNNSARWPVLQLKNYTEWEFDQQNNENPYVYHRGIAYIPIANDLHPLIVIFDGIGTSSDNYHGYDYIAKHLANNGFTVVVFNQSYIHEATGISNTETDFFANLNTANYKATHAINNLKFLLKMQLALTSPLYRKFDRNNVGIAGHAMGGDLLSYIEFNFNKITTNPDYDLNIKAMFAMGPTDYLSWFQIPVLKADYFLLFGSNDGIAGYSHKNFVFNSILNTNIGVSYYDENPNQSNFKALAFVYGANNQYFNTIQAKHCLLDGSCNEGISTQEGMISLADQNQITKIFAHAFFMYTLKNRKEYRNYLTGNNKTNLPQDVSIINQYLPKSRYIIQNFENNQPDSVRNMSLNQTLSETWSIDPEPGISTDNITQTVNTYRKLAWDNKTNGEYTISFSNSNRPPFSNFQYISFDVSVEISTCLPFPNPCINYNYIEPGINPDFSIVFQSLDDNFISKYSQKLLLSNYITLKYPDKRTKRGTNTTQAVRGTVRIPLSHFVTGIVGWKWSNTSKFKLLFDHINHGLIGIDNIQLTN